MFALKKVTPPILEPQDSKTIQAHQRRVVEDLIVLKRESAKSESILGKMLDVVNGSLVPVK